MPNSRITKLREREACEGSVRTCMLNKGVHSQDIVKMKPDQSFSRQRVVNNNNHNSEIMIM